MSSDRSFLQASIPQLISQLTPDEKAALLGAPNWWNTNPVPRLNIPSIRMSDGPNGVRGSSHFVATPAQCLPCETAMASSFDPEMVHRIGEFLADEAKVKSSVVLLAPTCNIQRSPLGGRAFESFSEDPVLSGALSAAYVSGLQSKGVDATIKHFVANDQESERTGADSVMTDRAMREIYLYPFMMAQKYGKPGAFMTSYGRLNGTHCSEDRWLLQNVLREEWGFKGIVMSDWYGTYSVEGAINAGLDLEMPGAPRWRTRLLVNQAIASQKLLHSTLDERAASMLAWVQKQANLNPEVVYGDGVERSQDSPENRKFCRDIAAEGIVVLKNEGGLLPLKGKKKILVVGPNAKANVISGGGSAALKPTYVITPYEGITQGAEEDVEFTYAMGCHAYKYLPTLETRMTADNGETGGWTCTFWNCDEEGNKKEAVANRVLSDTRVRLNDDIPAGLVEPWAVELTGKFNVTTTGKFEFGLTVSGRAKLYINGDLAINNWENQTPGEFFYGQGTVEEKATFDVVEGTPLDIAVWFSRESGFVYTGPKSAASSYQPALMKGVRLGGIEKVDSSHYIGEAVSLAKEADAVVFVAGLNFEWESEGFDRSSLNMPGEQDQAIAEIAAANPNTVVVVQCGSAISMPWKDAVNGIVHSWYLGNENGNAIADVLYGKINPSAKLPLTFPKRVEDIAAFPHLVCEYGKIFYTEDLHVGYRHFNAKGIEPLFPFGFGLSYTTFSLSNLQLKEVASNGEADHFALEASVTVKNTGSRAGSEVVQLYIDLPDAGYSTPKKQLKAFTKARDVAPGEEKTVVLKLDKHAVSSWNPRSNKWVALDGEYRVHVGQSSVDLPLSETYALPVGFSWSGL